MNPSSPQQDWSVPDVSPEQDRVRYLRQKLGAALDERLVKADFLDEDDIMSVQAEFEHLIPLICEEIDIVSAAQLRAERAALDELSSQGGDYLQDFPICEAEHPEFGRCFTSEDGEHGGQDYHENEQGSWPLGRPSDAAVAARSEATPQKVCNCGHDEERHGSDVPGCIECSCILFMTDVFVLSEDEEDEGRPSGSRAAEPQQVWLTQGLLEPLFGHRDGKRVCICGGLVGDLLEHFGVSDWSCKAKWPGRVPASSLTTHEETHG